MQRLTPAIAEFTRPLLTFLAFIGLSVILFSTSAQAADPFIGFSELPGEAIDRGAAQGRTPSFSVRVQIKKHGQKARLNCHKERENDVIAPEAKFFIDGVAVGAASDFLGGLSLVECTIGKGNSKQFARFSIAGKKGRQVVQSGVVVAGKSYEVIPTVQVAKSLGKSPVPGDARFAIAELPTGEGTPQRLRLTTQQKKLAIGRINRSHASSPVARSMRSPSVFYVVRLMLHFDYMFSIRNGGGVAFDPNNRNGHPAVQELMRAFHVAAGFLKTANVQLVVAGIDYISDDVRGRTTQAEYLPKWYANRIKDLQVDYDLAHLLTSVDLVDGANRPLKSGGFDASAGTSGVGVRLKNTSVSGAAGNTPISRAVLMVHQFARSMDARIESTPCLKSSLMCATQDPTAAQFSDNAKTYIRNFLSTWVPSVEAIDLSPKITEVQPLQGAVNDEITLIGSGFSTATSVQFGTQSAQQRTFTVLEDGTILKLRVPTGARSGFITVVSDFPTSSTSPEPFTVTVTGGTLRAPTNLTGSYSPGSGILYLNWRDSNSQISGFRISKKDPGAAAFTPLDTSTTPSYSYRVPQQAGVEQRITFHVQAYRTSESGAGAVSPLSNVITVRVPPGTSTTPPSAPGGFAASSVNATSATLRWNYMPNLNGYRLEVTPVSGAASIYHPLATATGHILDNLAPNTDYTVQLVAISRTLQQSQPALVRFQTLMGPTPPAAPTGLTASITGPNPPFTPQSSARLSWNYLGAALFYLEVQSGGTGPFVLQPQPFYTTSGGFAPTASQINTAQGQFILRVRASRTPVTGGAPLPNQLSDPSNEIPVNLPFTPPPVTTAPVAPSNLALSTSVVPAISARSVALVFNDNSSNETSFTVTNLAGNVESTIFTRTGSPGTSRVEFTLSNLTPSTTYSLAIRASNAAGSSIPSSPRLTVTTLPNVPQPPQSGLTAPTGLAQIAPRSTGSVTMRWTPGLPLAANAGYRVRVSRNGVLLNEIPLAATITQTSITGLAINQTYSVVVRAFDAVGATADSAPLNVSTSPNGTICPSAAFSGLTAVLDPVTRNKIKLTWNFPADQYDYTGFQILSDRNDTPIISLGSTTVREHTFENLAPATYRYRIRAMKAATPPNDTECFGTPFVFPAETVPALTAPTIAPTSLMVGRGVAQGTTAFSWVYPTTAPAVTGFKIYQIVQGQARLFDTVVGSDLRSMMRVIPEFVRGETYTYVIAAYNAVPVNPPPATVDREGPRSGTFRYTYTGP